MNYLKTIIKIANVSKLITSGRYILKDINLDIYPGELIGLLGHSGCGKSTLMNIISGIDEDYLGDIIIRSENSKNLSIYSRNIRFLGNNTVLFDYLNVFDNIKLGFRDDSSICEEDKNIKVNSMLHKLNLKKIADLNPSMLSHGQQQKIKFARAIIDNPDIVVLDEPFDGLDEHNSAVIYNIIADMHHRCNTTFIISSHDTYEILDVTTRLIIMEEGSIVVDSNKQELLFRHNKYSWHYFSIGSVIKGTIMSYRHNKITIKIKDYNFTLDYYHFIDKIYGKPKINKDIMLYINPRSQIVQTGEDITCLLIRIVDFIFYYQNIFKYQDTTIQINTTHLLTAGKFYKLKLIFSLLEVID